MKTIGLYLILWMGLTLQSQAQITVDNDIFPTVGDTLFYAFDNQTNVISAITPPGGNQQWDLSNLQASQTWQQIFRAPATGLGAAAFPAATLMYKTINSNREAYLQVTNNRVKLLGFYGDDLLGVGLSQTTQYNPPIDQSRDPINFFDINQISSGILLPFIPSDLPNGLAGQLPVTPDSLRIRLSVNRLDVVDGWGNMSIPGGTFEVLREKRTQYREMRLDAKVPPLGWLDITDVAIQAWNINTLGVDTSVSYHFWNNQSKETIAILQMNNALSQVTSVQYKLASTCSTPPTARCKTFTLNLTSNGGTALSALDVNDGSSAACGNLGLSVAPNSFSCADIGENMVTLTVTDLTNQMTRSCTTTVTVADPQSFCCTPPNAVCQDMTVQLNAGGIASITPAGIDNGSTLECGLLSMTLSRSNFGCEDIGSNIVTLTVTDTENQTDQCTATVTVEDNIDPEIDCNVFTITINGEETVALNPENLAAGTDNCGVAGLETNISSVACEDVGSVVPVTVTVSDPSGNTASCVAQVTVAGQPCGWTQTPNGIGCANGNEADYDPLSGVFTLTATGCYTPGATADESAFFKHSLCGNGSITAHITGLTLPGFAGIVMRETDAPGAKKVALVYQGGNALARSVRYTTNGASFPSYINTLGSRWLRIVRAGNVFRGYHSINGVNWIYSFAVTVPMNSCIQIGLIASGTNGNSVVTATFNNVVITPPLNGSNRAEILTEINPDEAPGVEFWPNPTGGQATLTLDPSWGKMVNIEIRDGLGQLTRRLQTDVLTGESLDFDLRDQAPGVYFIRMQNPEGRTAALRFVVARP